MRYTRKAFILLSPFFKNDLFLQANVQPLFTEDGQCRSDLQEVLYLCFRSHLVTCPSKRRTYHRQSPERACVAPGTFNFFTSSPVICKLPIQVRGRKKLELLKAITEQWTKYKVFVKWLGSVFAYVVRCFLCWKKLQILKFVKRTVTMQLCSSWFH